MKNTKAELIEIIERMNDKGTAMLLVIARKLILLKKYHKFF